MFFIDGLKRTYIKDKYLFENNLGERSKVFRIGIRLQSLLRQYGLSKYNVDSEYDRNIDQAKNFDGGPYSKYPDIIIHKRSFNNVYQEDRNNLLIIEAKIWDSISIKDFNNDCMKLRNFTSRQYVYKYLLGAHLCLGNTGFAIKWYERGQSQLGFLVYKYNDSKKQLIECEEHINFIKTFIKRY